jgi:hypothetical protein
VGVFSERQLIFDESRRAEHRVNRRVIAKLETTVKEKIMK